MDLRLSMRQVADGVVEHGPGIAGADPRLPSAPRRSPSGHPPTRARGWRNPTVPPLDCRAASGRVPGEEDPLMSRTSVLSARSSQGGRLSSGWSCSSRRSSCCSSSRSADAATPVPAEDGRDRLHRRHHGQPRRPDRGRRRHPDQARRLRRRRQTTEEDGKFDFTVTEPGDYLVGVDPDTLPKGSELRPPARRPCAVPTAPSRSTTSSSARATAATLTVRRRRTSTTRTSTCDEFLQSSVNGIRLGLLLALASVGLSPDLRHHRPLQLRARRAGDPGRHARLRPGQRRAG